jgi:CRISPR-associated protein Csm2
MRLPESYLRDGYFDQGGKHLREGIFKEDAKEVARVLAALKMTPTSLRAFYNKLKAIENRYKISNNDFDLIKPNLYAFERDVAYQVSRGVVSEEFRKFININSALAIKGPEFFRGFVEHFLSVLAYFKDVSR